MGSLFKNYFENEMFTVKYAAGPSEMIGREFHTYNEIIFFMGGEGRFIADNANVTLRQELVMVIPRANYHSMNITGDKNSYLRCVVHFNDMLIFKSPGEVLIADANRHIKYLFKKIISALSVESDKRIKNDIIVSAINLLLYEFSQFPQGDRLSKERTLSQKCVEIINESLCSGIGTAKIAEKLSVSQSTLCHTFKKEMNISVYKYILEKRLVLAREKILNGCRTADAALECGFNDYSGFYKQYINMFGSAPSRTVKLKNIE